MSEANKAIVRSFLEEVFSNNQLDVADEIYAPDHVLHGGGADRQGIENVKRVVSVNRTACPDLSVTIEDMIAEGDKVVSRHTIGGTHQATWMGVAPTGKYVSRVVHAIFRIADGKIAESWVLSDRLAILEQLDAYPPSR